MITKTALLACSKNFDSVVAFASAAEFAATPTCPTLVLQQLLSLMSQADYSMRIVGTL